MRALSFWLGLLALAGCTVGPDYTPPPTTAPAAWTEAAKAGPTESGPDATAKIETWWRGFGDPALDALIGEAAKGNYDVRIAAARIAEARAVRDVTAAGEEPSIGAGGHALRARSSTNASYPPGIGTYNDFELGFDASWEPDIFGETRRAVEAADAELQAAVEDRRAALVAVLSEVGADYATLRAAQKRIAIARDNIRAARDGLALARDRLDRGLSTPLEVAQARAQVSTVEAVVPELQALAAREIHALSILIGEPPGTLQARLSTPAPTLPAPPSLPLSLPSEIIRNRPDIRAAERRLAAANAGIGVAVAQYFPHFSIPLAFPIDSGMLDTLFDMGSLAWSFGVTATQPIYEGGRLEANERRARSITEESRLAYEKSVIGAFGDVEDALVSYGAERTRHAALLVAADADRTALDQATRLYRNGLGDFLKVLDAERSVYAAEDAVAESDLAEIRETIALFKALGAGWQTLEPTSKR